MQPTRSSLFRAYNSARKLARQGYMDEARLNRALGVCLRTKPRDLLYITTVDRCSCPDSTYRPGVACKHRLALVIQQIASELEVAA